MDACAHRRRRPRARGAGDRPVDEHADGGAVASEVDQFDDRRFRSDRPQRSAAERPTHAEAPGKIRFQYQKGVPLLIVGDGSSLTMIDYEVRQVQRWPVKNSPLGALLDPDRDLTKYAKVVPTGSNDVLSVEVKDPKRPEYGTITMVFVRDGASPGGLRLRGWVALDSQNNRTRIDLTNQKFNVAVADTAFKWTDPRPNKRGR
jgi:outer membrane lipoprotein-sorting protein